MVDEAGEVVWRTIKNLRILRVLGTSRSFAFGMYLIFIGSDLNQGREGV